MKTTFKALAVILAMLSVPASAETFPAFEGHPVIDGADVIPADREAADNLEQISSIFTSYIEKEYPI